VCGGWLAEQSPTQQFLASPGRHRSRWSGSCQVQVVVIDPSALYASGLRAALPHARIAVDHFHPKPTGKKGRQRA